MYVDYLTKLLNQRSYKTYLENVSFRVVILLFDIDNFKSINDNLGHVFGDTVLSIVGKTIKEVYSNYGYCYRSGGDEFCVILTKYDSVKELNDVFIDKLDKMRQSEPNLPYVSVGSAYFEPGYQDISDAIKSADENLYLQKSKLKSERESKTKTLSECITGRESILGSLPTIYLLIMNINLFIWYTYTVFI